MSGSTRIRRALAFSIVLGLVAIGRWASGPPALLGDPTHPFADVDGDLLPDSLEWVLMTRVGTKDTNGDGVDDFLESAQNVPPMGSRLRPRPTDHEMRIVVSSITDKHGRRRVIINLIARIVGGFEKLQKFELFLDVRGERIPIADLLANSLVHMGVRVDPKLGTYVIVSSALGSEREVRSLLPCTIGATGVIGGKAFRTGSYLLDVSGVMSTIVPIDDRSFAVQTLAPIQDPKTSPFWRSSQACVLELQVLGRSGAAQLCEVRDAGCKGAPTLRCAPSCDKMSGGVLVVPYGPGLLRGG